MMKRDELERVTLVMRDVTDAFSNSQGFVRGCRKRMFSRERKDEAPFFFEDA